MKPLLTLLIGLTLALPLAARELAVPAEDMLKVEIAALGLSGGGTPVVLLREPRASRVVPIVIGANEAAAIIRARENVTMPRPMTHDLFAPVFSALGATLERVFIDELANNTFHGALELKLDGKILLVDSRPSDAIAIALRQGASILLSPAVLEAASDIPYQGLEDEPVTAIGITVDKLTEELREALELETDRQGLLVTGVTGQAEAQGLSPGDLLLAVNGEAPDTPLSFLEKVRDTPEGEDAVIDYWQDGSEKSMTLSTDVPESRPGARLEREGGISL